MNSRGSQGGRANSRGAVGVTFLPTDAAPRPQSDISKFAAIAARHGLQGPAVRTLWHRVAS